VITPASVGLKSPVLNEIISSFPKLREPIKDLLAAVNLKKASEGKKDSMWTDLERYPSIIDADMVRVDVSALRDLTDFHQAMQVIEVELIDELKASKQCN
jgi:DNA mismatch repair protein MSH3